jgi:ubiquitin conjugation factor E4 B
MIEPISIFEDRVIGHIFRITLSDDQKADSAGHRLIYLPGHRQELEDEGADILFTKDRLDSIILEAASTVPQNKAVLDYLLPCWKRALKALKGLRAPSSEKEAILREAKRLCMSYCIFAVEVPDLFG